MSKYLESEINVENAALFYTFARVFNSPSLAKTTLRCLERHFTMSVETENFLELDLRLVAEILSSSELQVQSELDVFNAVRAWIDHRAEERNGCASDLLLKVRLHLLSENALKHVKSFTKIKDCSELIPGVLKHVKCLSQNGSRLKKRYCTHNMFNILLCYGVNLKLDELEDSMNKFLLEYENNDLDIEEDNDDLDIEEDDDDLDIEEDNDDLDIEVDNDDSQIEVGNNRIYSTDMFQVDGTNLSNAKVIASMPQKRSYSNAAYCNGEVYFFGGENVIGRWLRSVEKYSITTKTCEVFTDVHEFDQDMQCVCAFMNEIYLIGGRSAIEKIDKITNDCSKFNPKEKKLSRIAKMKIKRGYAACSVFDGNIVVTGGVDNRYDRMRSVEVYDHLVDAWMRMTDMCHVRSRHGLVAVRNKLFAVGGSHESSGEVYDVTSQRFAVFKNDIGDIGYGYTCRTISMGNKVIVCLKGKILCYDIDEEKWTEEAFEVSKDFDEFICVKIPIF